MYKIKMCIVFILKFEFMKKLIYLSFLISKFRYFKIKSFKDDIEMIIIFITIVYFLKDLSLF